MSFQENQDRAGEADIRDLPCAGFVIRDSPAQSKNPDVRGLWNRDASSGRFRTLWIRGCPPKAFI